MFVLTYHNVLAEEPDALDWPSLRLSRSGFEEEMAYLVRHFHPLPLSEVLRQLDEGRPDPLGVAVTFDDGFYGVLAYALPVLSRWGIPATVFLMTGYCGAPETCGIPALNTLEVAFRLTRREEADFGFWGSPPQRITDLASRDDLLKQAREKLKLAPEPDRRRWYEQVLQELGVSLQEIHAYAAAREKFRLLTWDEARQLLDAGIEIGSHTRTHRTLSRLAPRELEEELAGSYEDLRSHLGLSRISLSYPYGGAEHVGTAAPEVARRAGYTCAVSAIPGRNTPSMDRFLLRRVELRKLRLGLFEPP